ncbi:hypothetical protein SDC9_101557 [bioreactor metagenome]|uniref:Uncharacterized protein n=1 Tax=bioreactor metagenome TaxID=1076179 RepID=A0A645AP09_9ZZZZ
MQQFECGAGMMFIFGGMDGMQNRLTGFEVLGIFSAHEGKIKLCQGSHNARDGFRFSTHPAGKISQNAADLIAFFKLQFVPAIVQLHHGNGLHKKGGARRRLVVNNGFEPAFKFST